jgi:hypothetical protein
MNDNVTIPLEAIQLLFELDRADNPRLYDDLIRFRKGTKRVNRLRALAHEGLLAQHWLIGVVGRMAQPQGDVPSHDHSAGAITNEVFDDPISE